MQRLHVHLLLKEMVPLMQMRTGLKLRHRKEVVLAALLEPYSLDLINLYALQIWIKDFQAKESKAFLN